MQVIFQAVCECDVLVLATPIYTWYCTPPMKAVLDRFYGMNKYYGSAPEQRLWERIRIAIVTTCGYDIPYGAEPFETGIRRLCEHSRIPISACWRSATWTIRHPFAPRTRWQPHARSRGMCRSVRERGREESNRPCVAGPQSGVPDPGVRSRPGGTYPRRRPSPAHRAARAMRDHFFQRSGRFARCGREVDATYRTCIRRRHYPGV